MNLKAPAFAGLFALLGSGAARAEADWFASLYTGDGVELRADDRVFTLYALLNALGYDRAPVARQDPVPKYVFHSVRQEVRSKLGAMDSPVRKQADAFFDTHPQPVQHYLAYAVAAGPPPFDSAPKSKDFTDLKGFDSILRAAYSGWNLPDLIAGSQADYRQALKGYLTALDGPLGQARKLLRLADDGPSTLLVMNLLDGQDEAHGVRGERELVIVVGPSDKPNVEGVVREFARLVIEPVLAKKAQAGWPGGAGLLRDAQAAGAAESTVADYATALFARAAALKALGAPDAAYDAGAQKGYFGLKEISRGFEEARPLDAWAMDALARAETRRPAKR